MINLKKNYHRREHLQKIVRMNDMIYIYLYIYRERESARFMARSLSNFADNLANEILKIKYKDCGCFLEHECVKDNFIKYKWLSLGTKITQKG